MFASTLKTGAIAMAMSATLFGHVLVAEAPQPPSLLQLFIAIPKSPATIQDADKLVDWSSRKVAAITKIKASLDAHDATVQKLIEASDAKIRARMGGAPTPGQVERGGAAAGIDMARMQTDRAYAREMEAKMKTMSPQELMAMSTAMSRGMGMRGSVAVYDPPAVKAAAEAGEALMVPGPTTWAAKHQRRWADVAKTVAAIEATYAAKMPKDPGCDGEGGGGKGCMEKRNQYIAQAMSLFYARDAEIFRVETAALEEERAAIADDVRTADRLLVAAEYGATSQELGNPMQILTLDGTTVGQIGALAAKFEEIVARRAEVVHCGQKKILGGCWQ